MQLLEINALNYNALFPIQLAGFNSNDPDACAGMAALALADHKRHPWQHG